ncbi:uncharacterized protein LOC135237028 [Anguilla rostrata]|uniref:uncharacterized protein LOC135237028 n=1 Tax=Anguilla rostrata TaxID=7938 RepID=UPI0030D02E11
MPHLVRGSGHVLTSLVYFKLRIITKNSWLLRMVPESVGSLLGYCSNRKMLVWCWFLLQFFFHLIDAEAVYCIKELPCNVTECFKIRDSENVCSSIQQTEHCSNSGTLIKLKCEAQLQCFCNEEGPFELDELPEIPVKDQSSISMENEVYPEKTKRNEDDLSTPEVPERNNTNRTESSGSSMTPLKIAAAVAVPAVVGIGVGAIAYCVWKAHRMQGHKDAEQEERDPQRQPLAQDQNIMELEDRNGDGEEEVV